MLLHLKPLLGWKLKIKMMVINHIFRFHKLPGPKHLPWYIQNPIDFVLYQSVCRIVAETNCYAKQFLTKSTDYITEKSTEKAWKVTTLQGIKGFIAYLVNMSFIMKPTIFSQSENASLSTPLVSKMFAINRLQLLKFFSFSG